MEMDRKICRLCLVEEKLLNHDVDLAKLKTENSTVIIRDNEKPLITKICNNPCRICGVSVDDKQITKHIRKHFESWQKCSECKKMFKNIRVYRQHLDVCEEYTEGKTYSCKSCKLNFRYRSLYNLHLYSHKEEEPVEDKFHCYTCFRAFGTETELAQHTHNRRECPICKFQISRYNWRKHLKDHTLGPQVCKQCGAKLKSMESLRSHMAITHSKKSFKCEDCDLTFKVYYHYLRHRKSHTGEKDHVCERCGKCFLTKYYLNKHIRFKHLKLSPHVCEFCKKTCQTKNALRIHRRQHTNEKPYRCELCNQSFRQNVLLRGHRKSRHH